MNAYNGSPAQVAAFVFPKYGLFCMQMCSYCSQLPLEVLDVCPTAKWLLEVCWKYQKGNNNTIQILHISTPCRCVCNRHIPLQFLRKEFHIQQPEDCYTLTMEGLCSKVLTVVGGYVVRGTYFCVYRVHMAYFKHTITLLVKLQHLQYGFPVVVE